MLVFSDFKPLSGRRGIRLCYAYTAYWQYFSFRNKIILFILECVFITHTMTLMKKVKTNLTIDPKVKRNGERMAKKGGLSLSAFITTLLVKELAKEKKR